MRTLLCAVACALALAGGAADAPVLTVAEAKRLARAGETVTFRGTVVCEADDQILVEDDTGGVLTSRGNGGYRVGDVVDVTGRLRRLPSDNPSLSLIALRIAVCPGIAGRREPTDIVPADMRRTEDLAYRFVRITGRVTEAFRDEIDPEWTFLILERDGERAVVAVRADARAKDLAQLVEAELAVTGVYAPISGGGRAHLGPYVTDFGGAGVRVVVPAPDDPFAAAKDISFDIVSVDQAVRSARRWRTSGTVAATWGRNAFFLKTDDARRVRVYLAEGQPLPAPGARVTVVGFVRRSVFFARMSGALWRPEPGAADEEPPETVDARRILADAENRRRIRPTFDGRLIRLSGRIADLVREEEGRFRLALKADGETVKLFGRDFEPPPVGAVVEATGVCLLTEDLPAEHDFARLNGFAVVLRGPQDLAVVRMPPWWTVRRLLVVVGVLLLLVVAAIVWNVVQRKASALRIDERMRLAVELHDSVVQDFIGIGLQLEAVEKAYAAEAPVTGRLIASARRALDACCAELRGCLWDLRSDSFYDPDVSAAVRKVIEPHLGGAPAVVDVDVPRSRLSDAVVHAILRIVRELATNAVRHGQAATVTVRGRLKGRVLCLSVKDDGCGFDPARRPGAAEGHFGLRGVEERLERLGGSMKIVSAPGQGAEFKIEVET